MLETGLVVSEIIISINPISQVIREHGCAEGQSNILYIYICYKKACKYQFKVLQESYCSFCWIGHGLQTLNCF